MVHLRDTTAKVAPTGRSSIRNSNNIQVKHDCGPELCEHESPSSKSDRKTQEHHCNVTICGCEAGARDADDQKENGVCVSNAYAFTDGPNQDSKDDSA